MIMKFFLIFIESEYRPLPLSSFVSSIDFPRFLHWISSESEIPNKTVHLKYS